ncbi:NTP transferase domain-containing protein [Asticcacaulis sp. AND118]|uniref:nucleotidyltransferase family protein n=1 Tax=Asticcacaulis sp. AND118 TaxID=2840468 RepID=UPI001CFFE987|nr:nucleotidyltransferase family protein [Asticcacaulis sp. AND118]UDF04899.1 nucleotidyltransferase family protein [Asticcacaulis sp. AND118]
MQSKDMALILLAAGRSRRFDDEDKLMADLGGRPLGLHAARRLSARLWQRKLAMVGSEGLRPQLEALGFETLTPAAGNAGMGDNLALAANYLSGGDGALVCLADMPFVPLTQVEALLSRLNGSASIAISATGGLKSPPVAFGSAYFKALQSLSGDEGARRIIAANPVETAVVETTAGALFDIDTPDDLAAARKLWSGIQTSFQGGA